ncbi:MAG TPA: GAF domain-containing protein [Burkholderiaceae bacterium]|nr:GAF domain-containing protein [Burkholderiaceae bacterium]
MTSLHALRPCFEGATPAMIATCDPRGTPNVSLLSQIQFVDDGHVALSFQFFNKTRQNVIANPRAQVLVPHPDTGVMYRLDLRYLRTESEGPLFEAMKAKLAGIASHAGMSGVFRLLGADVYRVVSIEECAPPGAPVAAGEALPLLGRLSAQLSEPAGRLGALRRAVQRLGACTELDALLEQALQSLQRELDVRHAMILLLDRRADRLYTVASLGYPSSGAGSEIPLGAGLIGVAARERTPIRINHRTAEYAYLKAIRDSATRQGRHDLLETAIPLPGLPEPHSQLAVPMIVADRLLGVLFVESPQQRRFGYDDEDALVAFASLLAAATLLLQSRAAADVDGATAPEPPVQPRAASSEAVAAQAEPAHAAGPPVTLRHYRFDDSVFLDDAYLIKGVAGAILWLLAQDYVERSRTEFSNRELRLDPRLRLPEIGDNLEARLLLLQRRLADRNACIRIDRVARGRLQLTVSRPIALAEVD